ncbi:MAG: hypothetical protein IMY82_01960 [Chloroflexi bacterium]|nr:hypothetical protein [Chloroflexota bacterium]
MPIKNTGYPEAVLVLRQDTRNVPGTQQSNTRHFSPYLSLLSIKIKKVTGRAVTFGQTPAFIVGDVPSPKT